MKAVRFALLLLMTVAGTFFSVVTYRYLREQNIVDACLSGEHGSFDYSTMSCDLQNNHAYVPYEKRHPHDKPVEGIAICFIVIVLPIYVFLRSVDSEAMRTRAKASHSH